MAGDTTNMRKATPRHWGSSWQAINTYWEHGILLIWTESIVTLNVGLNYCCIIGRTNVWTGVGGEIPDPNKLYHEK